MRHGLLISLVVISLIAISLNTSYSETVSYVYDDLNRLIRVQYEDGTVIEYGYDNTGNRLTLSVTQESVSIPSTPTGPTSGMIDTSYTYTTGGSSSNLNHSVQYFFDWGDGTNTDGSLISDFVYANGKLVAKLAPLTVYFYHTDPAGTPLAMTDEGGSVVWRADYLPFGEENLISGTLANDYKFVGKEMDKETGLYYFGARYMEAMIGRFISPDPVGAVDARTGKIHDNHLFDPQRLNYYAYGLNNPYRYVDPDGNDPYNIVSPIISNPFRGLPDLPSPSDVMDRLRQSNEVIREAGKGIGNIDDTVSDAARKAEKASKLRMLGERGAKFTSKPVWQEGKAHIDVENPNPGKRPGQIHYQEGKEKYLYDPDSQTFQGAPQRVNDLLKRRDVQKGIDKAKRYLGEQ